MLCGSGAWKGLIWAVLACRQVLAGGAGGRRHQAGRVGGLAAVIHSQCWLSAGSQRGCPLEHVHQAPGESDSFHGCWLPPRLPGGSRETVYQALKNVVSLLLHSVGRTGLTEGAPRFQRQGSLL